MQVKSIVSLSLRIILTAAFVVFLIKSLLRLTSDDTGTRTFTENYFHFPSITLCPVAYDPAKVTGVTIGSGKTFEDFINLPSFKDEILAEFHIAEAYSLDMSK